MEKVRHPKDDTIAAIATPFGEGAVGIVRLSGSSAIDVADKVFRAKNGKPLATMRSYSLRYGWVVRDKDVVDEVVVSLMRRPRSYTREDVVEINSHGGARALSAILELVLEKGARLAEAGEFTKRAFLNGRLDLSQAEAVMDIIQAKSSRALKNSLSQLSGEVSRRIAQLRQGLLELLAEAEASIDFSEDGAAGITPKDLLSRASEISVKLKGLLKHSFEGKILREGLKVVIYGRPNTGKSSLLNAILKKERAIVTPIAGTTRDTIEEFIPIKGLAVHLTDTAGILEHTDEIEKEAIQRTQRALADCDLVLFVLDGASTLTAEDRQLARLVQDKRVLVVVNKIDQPRRIGRPDVCALFLKDPLEVSALTGENIAGLEEAIVRSVFDEFAAGEENVLISHARHLEVLKRALGSLETARRTLSEGLSVEFASGDLKRAYETLGELTGEHFSDEVLDTIFSKFCIGK